LIVPTNSTEEIAALAEADAPSTLEIAAAVADAAKVASVSGEPTPVEATPVETPIAIESPAATAIPPPHRAIAGAWAVKGLFILALIASLKLAHELLLPVATALILSLVFLPVVRGMRKLFIPAPVAGAVIVIGVFALAFTGVYNLAGPAGDWLAKAPQSLKEIGTKLRHVAGSVHDVATATAQVQSMTQAMATGTTSAGKIREVTVQAPSMAGTVLSAAQDFAVSTARTFVLLYFLLASGNLFLRKVVAATHRFTDKKREVDIANQVETAVSSYLFTVTLINIALGTAVGFAMYLMGVPNPVLWGVMVALFNFVPYLGEMTSIVVLSIVGLLSFDELLRSLMVPIVFYLLSAIEGYLVTPMVLGKRLSLNPVVIVLSVLFWGWMWGIPGALLAVPILVAIKTTCDRVDSLNVIGEFIGD
jgi:predicted PurR-regulated permease PerM